MELNAALVQLGDRLFREDTAAIELLLHLLLQQQSTYQADDRGGTLLIEALKGRIARPTEGNPIVFLTLWK